MISYFILVIFTAQLSVQAESNFEDDSKLPLQLKSVRETTSSADDSDEQNILVKFKNALNASSYEVSNCVYKTCEANVGQCSDYCQGPNVAAFNSVLNGYAPCYNKNICGNDLKKIVLQNVNQPLNKENCTLQGDYVTVTGVAEGLNTATATIVDQNNLYSPIYNVQNYINLQWEGLSIRCVSDIRRPTINRKFNIFALLRNVMCSLDRLLKVFIKANLTFFKKSCDVNPIVGAKTVSFQQRFHSNMKVELNVFAGKFNVYKSNIKNIGVSIIEDSTLSRQQHDSIESFFSSSEFVKLYKAHLMFIQFTMMKSYIPTCTAIECSSG